jgi:recombination protein RecA
MSPPGASEEQETRMPKNDAVAKVMDLVRSTLGKDSAEAVQRYGESAPKKYDVIPTGSVALDLALGVGGLPRGRIVEVYGPEASGKTTLTLHAIANAQRAGLVCGFVDAEHALDPTYASAIGVRMEDLILSQPDNGEQGLEVCEALVRAGAGMVVVDSVAALVPRAEIEGDMGDSHVGLQARLMSQALRKLTGIVSSTSTLVVFINQLRMKIGVMFGSPETTTGGNALKFYASVRLDVRRRAILREGGGESKEEGGGDGKAIGARTKVKVVKNKMAAPFREAEFTFIFGKGIDRPLDLLEVAEHFGLLEKSGSWYSYKGERIGNGRAAAAAALVAAPERFAALEADVRQVAEATAKS